MARESKIAPVLDQILQEVAAGQSVTRACKNHAVTIGGLISLCRRDEAVKQRYDDAIQSGSIALGEGLIDTAEAVANDVMDPTRAKVASEILKWILAKRHPKAYGDKAHLTVAGDAAAPMRICWADQQDDDKPTD